MPAGVHKGSGCRTVINAMALVSMIFLSSKTCWTLTSPDQFRLRAQNAQARKHRSYGLSGTSETLLRSQGTSLGDAKRFTKNSKPASGSRFLVSILSGSVVGLVQYICVVSRHLQECEWTLAADSAARRAFPSYLSGSSSSWLAWAFSSSWTWLFADVAHTASLLQRILRASSTFLIGLLAVQLLWTSSSWLRGKAPDEKIGIRMWTTVLIWAGTVQGSSVFCNLALDHLCIKSSWTGLPYYHEGHALCALSSILGGVVASIILSSSFSYLQDLLWNVREFPKGAST